eukprot:TRINITY_DN868_c0_g1_i1.p1 TRINITY_DN868_c0_g1~~TRINITY_DN868_c0_g1_i1.p1  ORF type:complete len:133 (+),score=1.81 TRINITY_DN868_c0_g1_i1:1236-1634(+)
MRLPNKTAVKFITTKEWKQRRQRKGDKNLIKQREYQFEYFEKLIFRKQNARRENEHTQNETFKSFILQKDTIKKQISHKRQLKNHACEQKKQKIVLSITAKTMMKYTTNKIEKITTYIKLNQQNNTYKALCK